MPLELSILSEIKENPSSFTKLELKGVTDDDIKQVVAAFPKDSHICEISIKVHQLTFDGYLLLLKLLKTHLQITSFYCEDVEPSKLRVAAIAQFNGAVNRLIEEHILAAKQKVPTEVHCNGHASQVAVPERDKTLVFSIKKLDPGDTVPVQLSEFQAAAPEKHSDAGISSVSRSNP